MAAVPRQNNLKHSQAARSLPPSAISFGIPGDCETCTQSALPFDNLLSPPSCSSLNLLYSIHLYNPSSIRSFVNLCIHFVWSPSSRPSFRSCLVNTFHTRRPRSPSILTSPPRPNDGTKDAVGVGPGRVDWGNRYARDYIVFGTAAEIVSTGELFGLARLRDSAGVMWWE